MSIARGIVKKWSGLGLSRRPGAQPEQLAEFERQHSVGLPPDFRAYLEFVDGMNDDELDDEGLRFWRLAEIKPVDQELKPIHPDRYWYPGCFVFADCLFWCWAYAIRLTGASSEVGNIFIVNGGDKRQPPIAKSFSGFARRYIHTPASLLP